MNPTIHRIKTRIRDALQYSPTVRALVGRSHSLRARLTRDPASRLEMTIQSYRFRPNEQGIAAFRTAVESSIWRDRRVGWQRYAEQLISPALTRTVVLKAPGPDVEKGVILVTFEYNWLRLLSGVDDLAALECRYDIIFSTSSSPSNYAMLGLALSSLTGPVFVQACNFAEIPVIEALHPRLACIPMLPCDWIDPACHQPLPKSERDIDILMVAGWAPVKRQWQFFDALSRMPASLRVVMIGQAEGPYDIEFARAQALIYGAPQDIEFHQSMPIESVANYQARAKVSLILSRREGCCVAVTESMFADTPVALIGDAHIGPLDYINHRTGIRLDRRSDLAPQLLRFIDTSANFSPRAWATENISNAVTTRKLNDWLREFATQRGHRWSRDIVAPCWRPHPTMRHNPDAAQLHGAYSDLHALAPKVFPADLMTHSHR